MPQPLAAHAHLGSFGYLQATRSKAIKIQYPRRRIAVANIERDRALRQDHEHIPFLKGKNMLLRSTFHGPDVSGSHGSKAHKFMTKAALSAF